MHFSHLAIFAGVLPLLAIAGPVANNNPLEKRGIDICNRKRTVGDACNFGSGNNAPHICGVNDPSAILHCVNGKWALERRCPLAEHCACSTSNDIFCQAPIRPPV
ncbi:hypothetical protein C1H76_5291 [Elsinoe australis]|uniref:Uncharacterized protein n=1 Tax=Elsinoe australis TaxID=40998 RepID=A0A4U7AVI7_9PEZI|nr:hypothetical protein C1H76_5291 [Elsinoe australis]